MKTIPSIACLLLLVPLVSSCGESAVTAYNPVVESDTKQDEVASMDAVTATAEPDSPDAMDENAPRPKREPDVIYVPTPQPVVDRMLELAELEEGDVLYDLGSGDGRIAITAAKDHGVRAVGIDINPVRIREANENARKAGVTDRVTFREEDLFEADIGEASVVTLYLLQSLNVKLRPKLLSELEPGTRIVSHAFDMAGEWEPEHTEEVDGSSIYMWTVPER